MLEAFVIANRDAIIERARARVATRSVPKPSEAELTNGIPVFLDQLGAALRLAQSSDVIDHAEIRKTAARHGLDLLRVGLTVAQVVRDYGDVCQAITDLAVEQHARISSENFRTLNLCLDDAIAEAVTEFGRQREGAIEARGTERLGDLAHELRNMLNTASMSYQLIRAGQVAPGGSTGAILGRSLMGLGDLVDRSLAEVRLDAGIERIERVSVVQFLEEVEVGALIHAQARGIHLTVTSVDPAVTIEGDRPILAAALANLLQNAFKFTPKTRNVSFATRVTADRVLFEIEDECGGLPPGKPEELFRAFAQRGEDRSGLGLGLSICAKAAKANGGQLRVRDLPGKGCVFTLDLPRSAPAPLAVIDGGKVKSGVPGGSVTAEAV